MDGETKNVFDAFAGHFVSHEVRTMYVAAGAVYAYGSNVSTKGSDFRYNSATYSGGEKPHERNGILKISNGQKLRILQ